MARGRLITQGPVAELAAGTRGRLAVTTPDPASAAKVLTAHGVTDLVIRAAHGDGHRVTGELPARPRRTWRS